MPQNWALQKFRGGVELRKITNLTHFLGDIDTMKHIQGIALGVGLATTLGFAQSASAVTLTDSVSPFPVVEVDASTDSVDLTLSGDTSLTIADIDLFLDLTGSGETIDSDGTPNDVDPPSSAFFDELSISLTSPSGTTVDLIPTGTYTGGDSLRFNITLDDSASDTVGSTNGGIPEDGTFAPVNSFAPFFGEPAVGTYTVTIGDTVSSDPKSLNAATLTVEAVPFHTEELPALVALGGLVFWRMRRQGKKAA